MRHYPKKNMVTSCIIADPRLPVLDVFTQTAAISPDDRFLICSDGVWENFDREEIEKLLRLKSVRDCADRLVKGILKNGANDNFSFILVQIEIQHPR